MEGKSDKSLETLRKLLKDHPESKEYNFGLLALGNGLLEVARCGGDGDGLLVTEAVKVLQLFVDRCPQAPEAEFARRKIAQARDIQSDRLYQMADYYRGDELGTILYGTITIPLHLLNCTGSSSASSVPS